MVIRNAMGAMDEGGDAAADGPIKTRERVLDVVASAESLKTSTGAPAPISVAKVAPLFTKKSVPAT
eukprot:COSAG06_NODE_66646_length_254_cov_0.400000_1_plen_65_part_01